MDVSNPREVLNNVAKRATDLSNQAEISETYRL